MLENNELQPSPREEIPLTREDPFVAEGLEAMSDTLRLGQ
jgi:hypothetical protein